jgi:adenylosuccinate lyase
MENLWSEEAKYRTWLDIEILACEGWAKLGKIAERDLAAIREKAAFTIAEILEAEKKTKHDVAAFVSVVQSHVGSSGRYIHLGLTSSDIVDTAFCYRLTKSTDLILTEMDRVLVLLRANALRDKAIVMIGRTHGIHAEPTTMGLKWLLWFDVFRRARSRLENSRHEVAVGKISGAVGTYALAPPQIEGYVCKALGLKPDTVSTQVVARDRFASFFLAAAQIAMAIEGVALEIRHLSRTEVGEVREGFESGQKGSSAMPHKRNPITAENLTGLSRLVRSYVMPALENCGLWHERDISHSSVERVIAPDACILMDYMLSKCHELLGRLEIFPDKMRENLDKLRGAIYSQKVLSALVERGLLRDEAYEIVQKNAFTGIDERDNFLDGLKAEPKVTKVLASLELEALFQPGESLKHIDSIYKKVLG